MAAVELLWIPLGAGGWFVRTNGEIFEALSALRERRSRRRLFHSALMVESDQIRYAIELCPETGGDHGRVAGGPVGAHWAGRWRLFRYEARCWAGGSIPDARFAVGGPVEVSRDSDVAERIISLVSTIPTPVWGRDMAGSGEMWNSNSVVSWLLEKAGLDASSLVPPEGGRAPGWHAGVFLARGNS